MYLEGKKLYQVLDRCSDLFPEWKREGDSFWNSHTGEIVTKNGHYMYDCVYRECFNWSDYGKEQYVTTYRYED